MLHSALELSSAVGRLRRESHSQEEQGTGTDLVSVLSKHKSKRLDSLKLLGANRSNSSHSWVNSPTGQTARTRLEIQRESLFSPSLLCLDNTEHLHQQVLLLQPITPQNVFLFTLKLKMCLPLILKAVETILNGQQ